MVSREGGEATPHGWLILYKARMPNAYSKVSQSIKFNLQDYEVWYVRNSYNASPARSPPLFGAFSPCPSWIIYRAFTDPSLPFSFRAIRSMQRYRTNKSHMSKLPPNTKVARASIPIYISTDGTARALIYIYIDGTASFAEASLIGIFLGLLTPLFSNGNQFRMD